MKDRSFPDEKDKYLLTKHLEVSRSLVRLRDKQLRLYRAAIDEIRKDLGLNSKMFIQGRLQETLAKLEMKLKELAEQDQKDFKHGSD